MSIKVTEWVWHNAPYKGSTLLLLLAIAGYAHDDGNGAYPSIAALAAKTRLSHRDIQYRLRELIVGGAIIRETKAGPGGVNIYSVIMS